MVSTSSKITVAEDGNKRINISSEDLTQCIGDLANFYKDKAPSVF
jgi:hypothetical protein